MTTWWVHPVGESDLMLDSDFHRSRVKDSGLSRDDRRKESQEVCEKRGEDIEASLRILQTMTDTGDRARLEELVLEGTWGQTPGRSHTSRSHTMHGKDLGSEEGTGTIPPIAAVLSALAEESSHRQRPVELVLLGTEQVRSHPLDTSRIARVLERALKQCAPARFPALRSIQTVTVPGQAEAAVLKAMGLVLSECAPPRDTGIVTVGSGSTALFLGAATGLVVSGLPLSFAQVSPGGSVSLLDSMDRHEGDVDPVVAQLIRWRQFRGLLTEAERASASRPLLNPEQTEVVRELARIQEAGYRAEDAESLRMLVADAIIRRDGTAGLAVRRYVESKYEELLEQEILSRRASEPKDLFTWGRKLRESRKKKGEMCKKPGRNPLGVILGEVKSAVAAGDFPHNVGLESTSWLTSSEVNALNEIGIASSHDLAAPNPVWVEKIRGELSPRQDGTGSCPDARASDHDGLGEVGLPPAPRTPRTGATLLYLVGKPRTEDNRPSVGSQFLQAELGKSLVAHLDLDGENRAGEFHPLDLTVLLFHTKETEQGAREQCDELNRTKSDSVALRTVCLCDLPSLEEPSAGTGDQSPDDSGSLRNRFREHLEQKLTEETGAVVLIPVGNKQFLLPLLQVLRRVTTERGVPLFLQEMANGCTDNHLWPALTGGNRPLLVAAHHAIETLELDVAWRLLAACGGHTDLEDRCQRLATAFTCRGVLESPWPSIGDEEATGNSDLPVNAVVGRTRGLASDRLRLVQESLRQAIAAGEAAEDPDRVISQKIRYLVLAAAVVERSDNAFGPARKASGQRKQKSSSKLESAEEKAGANMVKEILRVCRNDAPIMHGTFQDPDALVRQNITRVVTNTEASMPLSDGDPGVTTLLE
ncbi:MAG: hypothetical protein QG608_1978, partial [Actinomycetota bacterium]|nr:hypothetical protein [Actinomycetota bacterium]